MLRPENDDYVVTWLLLPVEKIRVLEPEREERCLDLGGRETSSNVGSECKSYLAHEMWEIRIFPGEEWLAVLRNYFKALIQC